MKTLVILELPFAEMKSGVANQVRSSGEFTLHREGAVFYRRYENMPGHFVAPAKIFGRLLQRQLLTLTLSEVGCCIQMVVIDVRLIESVDEQFEREIYCVPTDIGIYTLNDIVQRFKCDSLWSMSPPLEVEKV